MRRAAAFAVVASLMMVGAAAAEEWKNVPVVDGHNHWDMPLPAEIVKGTPYEAFMKGVDLSGRVDVHDQQGIDVAVVSVNDFWWWDINDQGLARAICEYHNETLARWTKMSSGRLYGMASIPLQFPELAVDMMQAAIKAVPLGQSAGQRILARLAEEAPHAVDEALTLQTPADRQSFSPMLAILSAQHEIQYSRLFRS